MISTIGKTTCKRNVETDTHLSREIFFNEVESSLVDQLILMRLQGLNLVQATAFLDHQAELVRFTDFLTRLLEDTQLQCCYQKLKQTNLEVK